MRTKRPSNTQRLDVRPIPLPERHARIYAAFDALGEGTPLIIVTDHEPRPLRLQLDHLHPQGFIWSQRHFGIGRWEVTLRRISAPGNDAADTLASFLRHCAVFSEAHEDTYRTFAQVASERTFDEGASIVEQDVQWPYLGLVRTGSLAAMMGSATGREQRLFDVLPCETVGAIETLDGGRTVARVVATTAATRVVLIPRGIVITTMAKDVAFARAVAAICAQRARALAEAFTAHVTQSAIVRVAAAILPYAGPDAGLTPSLEPLRRMTQTQLAATAGTVKEVAARAVAELEAVGALRRAKGRIALVDRQKLQAVLDDT